jgi:hypothetical protein
MVDGSTKVEEVQGEVAGAKAELSKWCPKVKKDSANLEEQLAKLKGDIRAMKPKTQHIAPPAANVAVPPALKAVAPAQKSWNSRPPKIGPVKVSPPLPHQDGQRGSLRW